MKIKMYEVGGKVRDNFRLNAHNNDIDYAVEAPSYDAMKEYLIKNNVSIFCEHPEFVTIRGKWRNVPCDFTLCRKEGEYLDNRHPSNCEPGTILEDLARRDFTMNAIAIDCETGGLIDPYNGKYDIINNIIRAVGEPNHRFQEDALRMLRALRFNITLGMEIHRLTYTSLYQNFHLLNNISAERIKDELTKMFKHDVILTLRTLHDLGNINLGYIFNARTKIWLEPTMKSIK